MNKLLFVLMFFISISSIHAQEKSVSGTTTSIVPPNQISVTLVNVGPVCLGQSVKLTATNTGMLDCEAGISYLWYTSNNVLVQTTTTNELTITPNATTSYYVKLACGFYSGGFGNTPQIINTYYTSNTITVTVNKKPDATINGAPWTPDNYPTDYMIPICPGTSQKLEVTNPITGYTYKWYNSQNVFVGQGTSYTALGVTDKSNVYFVKADANNGCGESDGYQIVIPLVGKVTLSIPEQTICKNTTATLTIPGPPISVTGNKVYLYQTQSSTDVTVITSSFPYTTLPLTQKTIYYLQTKNRCNELSDRVPVVVNVNELATLNRGIGSKDVCVGKNATFTASSPSTSPTQIYTWKDKDGKVLASSTSNVLTLPISTDTKVYVTVKDLENNLCESAPVEILSTLKKSTLTLNVTSTTICKGNDVNIVASTIPASTTATYAWYTDVPNSPAITPNPGKILSLTGVQTDQVRYVKVYDGCGWSDPVKATVTIFKNMLDPSVPADQIVCKDSKVNLTAINQTNPNEFGPNITNSISMTAPGLTLSPSQSATGMLASVTNNGVTISAKTTFTVVSQVCGFPKTKTFVIDVYGLPSISLTGISPVCRGTATTLTATPVVQAQPSTLTWYVGTSTTPVSGQSGTVYSPVVPVPNPNVDKAPATKYTVQVKDYCGQIASKPFDVNVFDLPVNVEIKPLTICPNTNGTVEVNKPLPLQTNVIYTWSGNGAPTASNVTSFTTPVLQPTTDNATKLAKLTYTLTAISNTCPNDRKTATMVVGFYNEPLNPKITSLPTPVCAKTIDAPSRLNDGGDPNSSIYTSSLRFVGSPIVGAPSNDTKFDPVTTAFWNIPNTTTPRIAWVPNSIDTNGHGIDEIGNSPQILSASKSTPGPETVTYTVSTAHGCSKTIDVTYYIKGGVTATLSGSNMCSNANQEMVNGVVLSNSKNFQLSNAVYAGGFVPGPNDVAQKAEQDIKLISWSQINSSNVIQFNNQNNNPKFSDIYTVSPFNGYISQNNTPYTVQVEISNMCAITVQNFKGNIWGYVPQPAIHGLPQEVQATQLQITNNQNSYGTQWWRSTGQSTIFATNVNTVSRPEHGFLLCYGARFIDAHNCTNTGSWCPPCTAYDKEPLPGMGFVEQPKAPSVAPKESTFNHNTFDLNVFPNPSSGVISFNTGGYLGKAVITNELGAVVNEIYINDAKTRYEVNMGEAKGIYFLRLTGGDQEYTSSFVIQ